MDPVSNILGEEYNESMQEIKDCDECRRAKMEGMMPGVCQFHLDAQMKLHR